MGSGFLGEWGSGASYTAILSPSFYFGHSDRCVVLFIVILICIFQIANEVE
jgi:hypothetical protein